MKPKTAKPNSDTVILLLTHVMNVGVLKLFEEIQETCSEQFDIFYLCDNTKGTFDKNKNDNAYILFSMRDLKDLPFPGKSSVDYRDKLRQENPHHKDFNFKPGSTDLPILYFYRNNSQYTHYWIIEYDVRYTGNWAELFSFFKNSQSDLLGTTITRFAEIRDWHHWPSLDLLEGQVPEAQRLRGFFPVYRLSRRALETLDRRYRGGVRGHYECLVPTVLHVEGLTLEDIGGDGEFVRAGNINRFYRNTRAMNSLSPGSFVFRPVMDCPGREPNKLWHPVKYVPPWRRAPRRLSKLAARAIRAIPGSRRRPSG